MAVILIPLIKVTSRSTSTTCPTLSADRGAEAPNVAAAIVPLKRSRRGLGRSRERKDEMMCAVEKDGPVLQLRVVVEVDDYETAVSFYRDALGLPEQAAYQGNGDARVIILDAGRATLELANSAQRRMIDEVEVGHLTDGQIRVAFEVQDVEDRTVRLVQAGAELVADPTETPWRSLNSRLRGPAGLQLTLFQELTTLDQREMMDGFGADRDTGLQQE
jgi:catechol 2,3-dioxygenase-like lactoylglutathione lyase family enzyme